MALPTISGGAFTRALAAAAPPEGTGRRWVFVPYDQLTDAVGPLSMKAPGELGIVLIECPGRAARRPYHQQKLALILANMRHFAIEQAGRGVAVRHLVSNTNYADALAAQAAELGQLVMMEAAERELRRELQPLVDGGQIKLVRHAGWISSPQQFVRFAGSDPPWRMDSFYRGMRKETGILMEGKKFEGGKLSFDAENRHPWKPGDPEPPTPPQFRSNAIKDEVCELVRTRYGHHPGKLDPASLPCTAADAERLWAWARNECLPTFGPYEDAMSRQSRGMFHTRIAALLNILRLIPERVVIEASTLRAPIASREGFIRQILGWREFVHHVHAATDGLRKLPKETPAQRPKASDAGYERWAGRPWAAGEKADPGARPDTLGAARGLPPAYWGTPSGLACLDGVVEDVWAEGWSHHIPRLMVLANLATLLDTDPRELTDWFWAAYVDAFDWVVEPNVLAMGTFSAGNLMTTKPYVSGAAYIARMSDSCKSCAFDPRKTCPITSLYWNFLDRHERVLADGGRMAMPIASLRKRDPKKRVHDGRVFEFVSRELTAGKRVSPTTLQAEFRDPES